jgi:hypothetical protein
MYKNTDKRKIYQLMDMYLSGEIDGWTFCNEYYYCYDIELDDKDLTELESMLFAQLSSITGRFTNKEKDLLNYPNVYYTEKELKQRVIETIQRLQPIV